MIGPTIGTTPLRQPEPRTPLRLADIERRDRDRLLGLTSAATPSPETPTSTSCAAMSRDKYAWGAPDELLDRLAIEP
jgi:hypothetical protein